MPTPLPRSPRIVWHLLALSLAAVLPFLALTTLLSYRLVTRETEEAQANVQRSVEITVNSVDRLLLRVRTLLRGVTRRELSAALDPARCDPALQAILNLNHPDFSNVFTVSAAGKRICSAVQVPPGTSEQVDPTHYLDAVQATKAFALSPPTLGQVSAKWTVYAAEPILRDGGVAGVAALGVDLRALTAVLDPRTLPMDGVVAIVTRDGTVVTRHPDAEHWIGRDGSASLAVQAARRGGAGSLRAVGLDGIDRIWAYDTMRDTGWLVFAGVSSAAVLEVPRARTAWILAIGGSITLLAIALSLALARRISGPIEAMAAAAPSLGVEGAQPLVLAGPAEAITLADELNRSHQQRLGIERTLRAERGRLEGLVASAMDAVITVDADHRIVVFNGAAERMFGVPAGAAMGESLDRLIPPRFRTRHEEHLARFEGSGATARQMGALGTVWGVRANGEEFPVEAAISQLEVGGQRFLTAIVRDITEHMRAEAEILTHAARLEQRVAERTAELEAANKELEAFDYSISHDLRGPLGRILGFATALEEDCGARLDDAGRRYIERISATARSMDQLVKDMLELATISRTEIVRQRVDLAELARETLDALGQADPERRVEVVVQDSLDVHADPGLTRIVLDNLLGNAWKFTSRRADASIEVGKAEIEGYGWAFFVRDNGAGFDSRAATHLFEPFRRFHSQAEFKGTGVGLATVSRIVRRHGGRAWADAAVGTGATFYFTFQPAREDRREVSGFS